LTLRERNICYGCAGDGHCCLRTELRNYKVDCLAQTQCADALTKLIVSGCSTKVFLEGWRERLNNCIAGQFSTSTGTYVIQPKCIPCDQHPKFCLHQRRSQKIPAVSSVSLKRDGSANPKHQIPIFSKGRVVLLAIFWHDFSGVP